LYSSSFSPEWQQAIEFADLVIPITAFFSAIQGLILIIVAGIEENVIRQGFNNSLWNALDVYYTDKSKNKYRYEN
jgi:hypothetical protein